MSAVSTGKVAVVDAGGANLGSVCFALERLGVRPRVVDDAAGLAGADRVILPGVGAAPEAMRRLRAQRLVEPLRQLGTPLLGICLGMQLMCASSEEGNTPCLGIFDTTVKRFIPQRHEDKVPHMGWNTLTEVKSGLFSDQLANKFVYFVHSYYVPVNEHTVATTDYILPFSAAMQKDNFFATQFHPEKSGTVGELILQNFINL